MRKDDTRNDVKGIAIEVASRKVESAEEGRCTGGPCADFRDGILREGVPGVEDED